MCVVCGFVFWPTTKNFNIEISHSYVITYNHTYSVTFHLFSSAFELK